MRENDVRKLFEPFALDEEKKEELWEAVCSLNEQLRAVVVLYYYQGFSVREISSILGISQANVKTRLSRARKCLREQLEVLP